MWIGPFCATLWKRRALEDDGLGGLSGVYPLLASRC